MQVNDLHIMIHQQHARPCPGFITQVRPFFRVLRPPRWAPHISDDQLIATLAFLVGILYSPSRPNLAQHCKVFVSSLTAVGHPSRNLAVASLEDALNLVSGESALSKAAC